MPTIKIPENVLLVNPDGSLVKDANGNAIEVDFVRSFLVNTISNDSKFGKDLPSLRTSMDLVSAFENKKAGDEVFISQEMWTKLKEVVNEPSVPYNVAIMKQCRAFFDAILEPVKA